MRRFNVEGWFLASPAANHRDRIALFPSLRVEARDEAHARELYAARYQIPRDYWHEPRARSLAEVRVRTARGGVAVHHQPLCLMRVEAA